MWPTVRVTREGNSESMAALVGALQQVSDITRSVLHRLQSEVQGYRAERHSDPQRGGPLPTTEWLLMERPDVVGNRSRAALAELAVSVRAHIPQRMDLGM